MLGFIIIAPNRHPVGFHYHCTEPTSCWVSLLMLGFIIGDWITLEKHCFIFPETYAAR
ncbi:hypothetical protein [Dactylococcopsis salina]|uniref:hypothetical protein n=1 Tax=Dactylococcopsis salina TaxID=292566 RepID=UPI0002F7A70A|nr:hypothetical protein [Dactylococcopsis salina]